MLNPTTLTNMCTLLKCDGAPIAALNQAEWAYNQFFVPFFTQNQLPVEQHDPVVNAMLVAAGEAGFDVATQVPAMFAAAQAMATQQTQQNPPQSAPPAGGPTGQPGPQTPVNGPTAGQEIPGQQHLIVPNMPINPVSDSPEAAVSQIATEPASSPATVEAVHKINEDGTAICGECGKEYKTVTGLKSHLTRTHELKWKEYCVKNNIDKEGNPLAAAPEVQTPDTTAQIPNAQPPAGPDLSAGPVVGNEMPVPPAPAGVTTVAAASATVPLVQTAPPAQVAPPVQQMQPVQQQAPPMAMPPGYQPATENIVQQPTVVNGRADIAILLGGIVDLMIVPLLEASTATDQLKGRTDANQLAQLALAQAMLEITDPDDIKFKRHRDVSLRIFGELLTKHPNVFVFQQGYNYLLSDEYFPIISSRATRVTIVADKGKTIQTVDLE